MDLYNVHASTEPPPLAISTNQILTDQPSMTHRVHAVDRYQLIGTL